MHKCIYSREREGGREKEGERERERGREGGIEMSDVLHSLWKQANSSKRTSSLLLLSFVRSFITLPAVAVFIFCFFF